MTKKLVNGQIISVKDDTGAYIPAGMVPKPKTKRVRDPKPSDINLTDLLDKHLLLLYRETRHLLRESANGGKLNKDNSHSLRENMKLIMELRKKEKEFLEIMSPEEIEALINEKSKE